MRLGEGWRASDTHVVMTSVATMRTTTDSYRTIPAGIMGGETTTPIVLEPMPQTATVCTTWRVTCPSG
jgi:hypothetical protein